MAELPLLAHDGKSIKIWSHIFRTGDWIEQILEISKGARHLPVPLLLGADLKRIAEGNTEGCYLSLLLQDWSGDSKYCQDLFSDSLQKNKPGEKPNEIFLVDSGITLHMEDVLTNTDNENDEIIEIWDPRVLFEQKDDGSLFSFAMYYGAEAVTKIRDYNIRGIQGVTRQKKRDVAELCQVQLESRLRTPLWRWFKSSKRSTDVVYVYEYGKPVEFRKRMPGDDVEPASMPHSYVMKKIQPPKRQQRKYCIR